MWTDERILARIKDNILRPLEAGGLNRSFSEALSGEFPHMLSLFRELYGHRYDCLYQLEDLIGLMARKNMERPSVRGDGDKWFKDRRSVGMMLYVDLFNSDLAGLEEKLDYFSELGINALHLMPLFKSPEGESDGGYAVSDYGAVRSDLGTMDRLASLAVLMRERGIHLILDFILNHTSDEHDWAVRAGRGESEFQDYYYMFDSREEADEYGRHLRDIFPAVRKGSFTFREDISKWVWTTFNSYQWDLNYGNPEVFRAMCGQMLFLANQGVDVLRLDALAFTWKEKGSGCENLPKAHSLIKLFKSVASVAAPGLSFLSEAIVHPDEVVRYIYPDECELSYNPLLMATSWEALATRNTSLLKKSFSPRFSIHRDCRWVNYIRCHDDIGWTFCDRDAEDLGIDGFGHRKFLNDFYTGRFPGSFAAGIPFQENAETGDARICGTLASLAGLEKALMDESSGEIALALKRIKLLLGSILSFPGIPMIYSGDEMALLNNYDFMDDSRHSTDSRWVHRFPFPWEVTEKNGSSIHLEVRNFVEKIIALRTAHPAMGGRMEVMDLKSGNLLGYRMTDGEHHILVILNFTERPTEIELNSLRLYGGAYRYEDLITGRYIEDDFEAEAYSLFWLEEVSGT